MKRNIIIFFTCLCATTMTARQRIIPFHIDSVGRNSDRSVAIMIKAEVNGKAVMFMLDTGAGTNIVSPKTAQSLGLTITGDGAVVEGNGKISAQRALAKKIKIGNLQLRNVPFVVADNTTGVDSIDRYLHHLDAIIGLPLIRQLKTCEIDFRNKLIRRIKISKNDANQDRDETTDISFGDRNDILTMRILNTGDSLNMILDTGASHSALSKEYIALHKGNINYDSIDSVAYAGFGGIITGHEYRLKNFDIMIGKTFITLPTMTVFDGDYDQRIGMDFFSKLSRMIIDLKKMKVMIFK